MSVVFIVFALGSFASDRAAERSGNPNDLAGLGEFLGALLLAICILLILAIGIPLLRLRAQHPAARIALIAGEAVTALPFAFVLGLLINGGYHLSAVNLLVPLVDLVPLIVIGLLCTGQSRTWSRRSPAEYAWHQANA